MTETILELSPGTIALRAPLGDRSVFAYLFTDGDSALLLDTGDATTAEFVILPALRELAIEPGALEQIVVTHPDVDHQGGLARIRAFAPSAQALCGFEDQAMVSDPERMVQQRYRAYLEHGLDYSPGQLAGIRAVYGAPVPIETTLVGGERLHVGGRELRVHHGPGHAAGHLMLEDPALGALFISDAVHGRYSPAVDGGRSLPPTYEDVDAYLATIASVRELAPKSMHSGHFDPMLGDAIKAFLDESASFVGDLDRLLLEAVASEGLGLGPLCDRAAAEFGPFTAPNFFFMFAVHGHLRRLGRVGRVEQVVEPPDGPPLFRAAS